VPAPSSTYRLQIRPSFDLSAAADVCDYLAELGVGAVYLSPVLPASAGSDHGYDVVGFDRVDPARGGEDGWARLVAAARARGLGVVVDIVPNHAGVGVPAENTAWWDVLRLGASSPYAAWFDIDWSRGRVLLPVLADDFAPEQLSVSGAELAYGPLRFPIAPGTEPAARDSATDAAHSAAEVHDRQHYELVSFRRGDAELNYRRFFAVASLAGLRVEDPAVFAATHERIARWVRDGEVDGLRVDHPDGLADPLGYLVRLRELAGPAAWLTVEKILEPGETLPPEWPVDGTTGYDALAEVGAVFVDPAAAAAFDASYRSATGDQRSFAEHAAAGKRRVATTILRAEVERLARLAPGVENAAAALTELAVAFPVYRSYLPTGAPQLARAMERVRAARPDLTAALGALVTRLADPADELCRRFQQLSGAVMAKGVEDTAYYRYTRFVAANEVGGDPARFGLDLDGFHQAQSARAVIAPAGMTALSTHDTKRGEDVRARLAALSELPEQWAELVAHLRVAAPVPDPAFGCLLWQSFLGAGFIDPARMHAYAEKAMREAAVFTTWTDPDPAAEAAVHAAVDAAYDQPSVHEPLAALMAQIHRPGQTIALGQKLVQLTMPGVPDCYQGTELWGDSLVDPDNRRAVDLGRRAALLRELDERSTPPPIDETGAAKLWVVSRAQRLRRDRPQLFEGYRPIRAVGAAADHLIGFDRGGAITLATRLPTRLSRDGGWRDTTLALGRPTRDLISGRVVPASAMVADVLADYPAALLIDADT
jgi:(1->4)-alpha-D-glucan 1-alpha-D-glucosylmutase